MKKFFFCLMALNMLLPVLTWGEDADDEYKYVPQTIVTGDASAVADPSGDFLRYKYNPIEDQWKIKANKCTIKYNPMTDNWSYVYPGEVLRFNPAENNWDYQFTEKRLQYDILAEKWFYGYPGYSPLSLR